MAAHESTTSARARITRDHQNTPAVAARVPPLPAHTTHPSAKATSAPAPADSPDSFTHILGHMIDGIAFIETACVALEADDRTAFAMPSLHHGISMVRHAHDALERVDAAPSRCAPRVRSSERRVRGRSR